MKRIAYAFLLSFAVLAGQAAGSPGGHHGDRHGRTEDRVAAHAGMERRAMARQHRHDQRAARHQAAADRHHARAARHQVAAGRHAAAAHRHAAAVQRHDDRGRHERKHQAAARAHERRQEIAVETRGRVLHKHGQPGRAHELAQRERRHGAQRIIEQPIVERQQRALRHERELARAEARRTVFPGRVARARDRAWGVRPAGPMRFRGLDRNGDRVVTRLEWRGNDRSFSNHDWNGDGILSGVEVVPSGGRAARVARVGLFERFVPLPRRLVAPVAIDVVPVLSPPPLALLPLPPLDLALPLRLDENRLERLVRVEGFVPIETVVRRVAVAPVDRLLVTERFVVLDRNRDAFLSFDEWSGPRALFVDLDRNRDRLLVRDELVLSAPRLRSVALVDRDRFVAFDLLDMDDDGVIAPWEWTGDIDVFFRLDANADGALEQGEYLGLVSVRPLPVRMLASGALDCDHNGYISRSEWVGDPFRFVALDLNGDGRLRSFEAMTGSLLIKL
jgi:hypothetical protein